VRLLLQRVTRAEVRHADGADAGETVGRIERGLLVLVGVAPGDGADEVAWAAGKLLALRVFPDATGKMNLDVVAAGGGLLVVSQFTLYADTRRGRRPGSPPRPRPTSPNGSTSNWSSACAAPTSRWPPAPSAGRCTSNSWATAP
jgi:D-aminoacyl-tRNA deacylase